MKRQPTPFADRDRKAQLIYELTLHPFYWYQMALNWREGMKGKHMDQVFFRGTRMPMWLMIQEEGFCEDFRNWDNGNLVDNSPTKYMEK